MSAQSLLEASIKRQDLNEHHLQTLVDCLKDGNIHRYDLGPLATSLDQTPRPQGTPLTDTRGLLEG